MQATIVTGTRASTLAFCLLWTHTFESEVVFSRVVLGELWGVTQYLSPLPVFVRPLLFTIPIG